MLITVRIESTWASYCNGSVLGGKMQYRQLFPCSRLTLCAGCVIVGSVSVAAYLFRIYEKDGIDG
jgi:hypothetical protein